MRVLFLILSLLPWSEGLAKEAWKAGVPNNFTKEEWVALVEELGKHNFLYGRVAASGRMLIFYDDLEVKKLAYQTVIESVDRGYALPVLKLFAPSQLALEKESYASSFNTYKVMINTDRGTQRWAENYLKKIDQEQDPKYLFFQATQAYTDGKIDTALESFKKVVGLKDVEVPPSLIRKAARNIARIYYEKQDYKKSLEIYSQFLLRLNPVEPTDWLETAWVYYMLGDYSKALGLIFNLESKAAKDTIYLEAMVLRGLIYVANCNNESLVQLRKSFEDLFGKEVQRVKLGKSLGRSRLLKHIRHPKIEEYRSLWTSIENLKTEGKNIDRLDKKFHPIARYLYRSELKRSYVTLAQLREKTTQEISRELVNVSEGLRFLQFQGVRESFRPERVFQAEDEDENPEISEERKNRINWAQVGDFWRDERLNMRSRIVGQCSVN